MEMEKLPPIDDEFVELNEQDKDDDHSFSSWISLEGNDSEGRVLRQHASEFEAKVEEYLGFIQGSIKERLDNLCAEYIKDCELKRTQLEERCQELKAREKQYDQSLKNIKTKEKQLEEVIKHYEERLEEYQLQQQELEEYRTTTGYSHPNWLTRHVGFVPLPAYYAHNQWLHAQNVIPDSMPQQPAYIPPFLRAFPPGEPASNFSSSLNSMQQPRPQQQPARPDLMASMINSRAADSKYYNF